MLKEASSAAAERAKQNVMKAYENATKLSLNVKITVKFRKNFIKLCGTTFKF